MERLRELGLFRLKERQLKGNLAAFCNDLMEEHREQRAKFFSEVYRRRMIGNRRSWNTRNSHSRRKSVSS